MIHQGAKKRGHSGPLLFAWSAWSISRHASGLNHRSLLFFTLRGRPGVFPLCARPTRGVRDRALREHRESLVALFLFYSIVLGGEWPRLPFTVRIERAPSERARSASKEGTWPLPEPLLIRVHQSPRRCGRFRKDATGCIQDPNATVGEKHEPGGASSGFFVADR